MKTRMCKWRLKTMLIVFFFDIRNIVHHDYVPAVQTVIGKFYASVLERLRACIVQEFLVKKALKRYRAPYFPCNFLFVKMKTYFMGTHYGGVQEVKDVVTMVLNRLTSEDCQECFEF